MILVKSAGGIIMRLTLVLSVVLSTAAWFNTANAGTGIVGNTQIQRLLSTDGKWGGCAVRLAQPVQSSITSITSGGSVSCPGNLLSLDCVGNQITKSAAQNLFASAQLAYVTGGTVDLYIDDSVLFNGYCRAYRIDNK